MQFILQKNKQDKNNKLNVIKKFLSAFLVVSLIFNGMNVISFADSSFYWRCNFNAQEEDLLYNYSYWVGGA